MSASRVAMPEVCFLHEAFITHDTAGWLVTWAQCSEMVERNCPVMFPAGYMGMVSRNGGPALSGTVRVGPGHFSGHFSGHLLGSCCCFLTLFDEFLTKKENA